MTKHLTSMRLNLDTKVMIDRMAERTGANATEIVSNAVLLMWLVSGGGKYEVDPIALGMPTATLEARAERVRRAVEAAPDMDAAEITAELEGEDARVRLDW